MGMFDNLLNLFRGKEKEEKVTSQPNTADQQYAKNLYRAVVTKQKKVSDLSAEQQKALSNYLVDSGHATTYDFNDYTRKKYGLSREGQEDVQWQKYGQSLFNRVSTGKMDKNKLSDQEKSAMYNYMLETGKVALSDFNNHSIAKYKLGKSRSEMDAPQIEVKKDDDGVGLLDSVIDYIGGGIDNFQANIKAGRLSQDVSAAYGKYLQTRDPKDLYEAQKLAQKQATFLQQNKDVGEGNWITNDFANYLPQLFDQTKAMAVGGLGGAAVGGMVGSVPGAVTGAKVGATLSSAKYGYDTMSGAAYQTLLEMGVPDDIATKVATNTGLINSLIEGAETAVDIISFGTTTAAKAMGKTVTKEAAEEVAEKVMKDKLKDAAMSYGWKPAIKAAGKTYVTNLASETAEEASQEAVSILGEQYAARASQDRGVNIQAPTNTLDDAFARIGEAGAGGFKIAAVGGAMQGGTQVGKNLVLNKYQKDNITQVVTKIEDVTADPTLMQRSVQDGSIEQAVAVAEQKLVQIEKAFPEDRSFITEYRQRVQNIRNAVEAVRGETEKAVPKPEPEKPAVATDTTETTDTTDITTDVVTDKPVLDAEEVVTPVEPEIKTPSQETEDISEEIETEEETIDTTDAEVTDETQEEREITEEENKKEVVDDDIPAETEVKTETEDEEVVDTTNDDVRDTSVGNISETEEAPVQNEPKPRKVEQADTSAEIEQSTANKADTKQEERTEDKATNDTPVEEKPLQGVKSGEVQTGDVVQDERGQDLRVVEVERNGKTVYGLRDDDIGTTDLFDTKEDLQKAVDRMELEKTHSSLYDTREQALANIDAEERQTKEDTHGFTDGKSKLQQGNIKKTLTKRFHHNGKVLSNKQFIEQNLDKRVDAVKRGNRTEYRLYIDDTKFYNITKTEYEYHQHLNNIGFEYDESVYNKDFEGMRKQAQKDYDDGLQKATDEYNARKAQRDAETATEKERETQTEGNPASDTPVEEKPTEGVEMAETDTTDLSDTNEDDTIEADTEITTEEEKTDVHTLDNGLSTGDSAEVLSSTESDGETDGVREAEEPMGDESVQRDAESIVGGTVEDSTGDQRGAESKLRNDGDRSDGSSERDVSTRNYGYVISPDTDLGGGTPVARYNNNVKAIETMNAILSENRQATAEEMEILAKFSGWGGLKDVFLEGNSNKAWNERSKAIRKLLTEKQYKAARASSMDAFYTPTAVVNSIYDILNNIGVNGYAKFLEPSCGSGVFLGCMPVSYREHANIMGVELDEITGNIAKLLYPNADIKVQGFEKTNVKPNSVDVVMGNVPFGDFKAGYDKNYKAYSKYNIHDYFMLKTLDTLREGGVMAVITTSGTLDKQSNDVRKLMNEKANLVGAVRFAAGTFNATDVVADLLILQKKGEHVTTEGNNFLNLATHNGVSVNEYFAAHPEMILGDVTTTTNQYGQNVMTVKDTGRSLADVVDMFPKNLFTQTAENITNDIVKNTSSAQETTTETDYSDYPTGTVYEKDGVLYKKNDEGQFEPYFTVTKSGENKGAKKVPKADSAVIKRVKGMLKVLDAYTQVIDIQKRSDDDAALAQAQKVLNDAYDAFVDKYGAISGRANKLALESDPRYWKIASLEKKAFKNGEVVYQKEDVFSKRTIFFKTTPNKVNNAKDALTLSLNVCNNVNLAYMEEKYGKSREQIINELGNLIYELPETENSYVTADEYLSGNVKEKLKRAEAKAAQDPRYERNVEALRKVQPVPLTADEISVDIGSPFLGEKYMGDFMRHLLGMEEDDKRVHVFYDTYRSGWTFNVNNAFYENRAANQKWGTDRVTAVDLVTALANKREIKVMDTIGYGQNKRSVFNEEATNMALAKADEIKEHFSDWVFRDMERRNYLVNYYNEHYNNIVTRKFDGTHLQMPGSTITLRPHQAAGVARILSTKNTLLAHPVGSGKTFTMIGAAFEMKRLGIARKPLMVVPNHKLGDFLADFYKMYPGANILAVSDDDFTPANKKRMLAKIQNSDFDCVIMRHSSFGRFGFSPQYEQEYIQRQMDELESAIMAATAGKMNKRELSAMENQLQNLQAKLDKLLDTPRENIVYFDESGIDAVIVDEAHNFKKLTFPTKMTRVAGVDSNGSAAATHMHMATEMMNRQNGAVVFATGTPVSNTMGELYSLMRYLNPQALAEYSISSFDAWADTFGEIITNTEMNTTGSKYITKRRFSKFKNVPELIKIFKTFADIVDKEDLKPYIKLPAAVKNHITAESSLILKQYNAYLDKKKTSMSYEEAKAGGHLVLMQDARMAALDLRSVKKLLIENGIVAPNTTDAELDLPGSKINLAVENIFNEYQNSNDRNGTQVVFLDRGVPGGLSKKDQDKLNKIWAKKEEDVTDEDMAFIESCNSTKRYPFDLYNDIKNKLIAKGVKPEHIAFIQDNNTTAKKQALFDKINAGEVRILLGSTSMMGEGMNVQRKAVALHQLDAPMRPSDVEQRIGRVQRQGNENETVTLYNYSTLNSYDAPTWGMLDRKNKTINQIMKGDESIREVEDLGEDDFATMSVEAANNPLMFERKEVSDSLNKLKSKKKNFLRERNNMQDIIAKHPQKVQEITERIKAAKSAHATYTANADAPIVIDGKEVETMKEGSEAIKEYVQNLINKGTGIGSVKNLGTFKGFQLIVKRTTYGHYTVTLGGTNITPVEADVYANEATNASADKPSTVLLRLNNQLKNLETVIPAQEKALENEHKQFEDAKANVNGEFGQESEIARLSQRLREIDNELNKTAEANTNPTPTTTAAESSETDDADEIDNLEAPDFTDLSITQGTGTKKGTAKDTNTASELVQKIEKAYGIHIAKGNIRGSKRVMGQHRYDFGVRSRYANDIPVISHEVGHHLDRKYKLSEPATMRHFVNNDAAEAQKLKQHIIDIGRNSLPTDQRQNAQEDLCMREGIAEVVRRLFSNRDDLDTVSLAVEYIRGTVSEQDNKLFDDFYKEIVDIADLPVEEKVANDISINEKETTFEHGHEDGTMRGKSRLAQIVEQAITKVFDRTKPLDNLMDMIVDDLGLDRNTLSYEDDFYTKERLATGGAKGIVVESLMNKQRNLNGDIIMVQDKDQNGNVVDEHEAPGLKSILQKVYGKDSKQWKQRHKDFASYLVAMRSKDYAQKGLAMPESYATYNQAITTLQQKYPDFEDIRQELAIFMDNELKMLVEAGMLGKEQYKHIKATNEYYAPLKRIVEGHFGTKSNGQRGSLVKKAKGGGETIIDPLESIVQNAFLFRQAAMRNDAVSTMARMVEQANKTNPGYSTVMQKLPAALRPITVNLLEFEQELLDQGVLDKNSPMYDEQLKAFDIYKTLFRPNIAAKNANEIVIYSNGKPVVYKITDRGLFDYFMSTNKATTESLIQFMSQFSRLLRTGTVTSFKFPINNFMRDVPTAIVQSEAGIHIGDIAKAIKSVIRKDDRYHEFMASGAATEFVPLNDRRMAQNMLNQMFPRSMVGQMINVIYHPIETFRNLTEASEIATRLAEYTKLVEKKGVDKHKAALKARTITGDFTNRGSSKLLRNITSVSAFSNAALQGTYEFLKACQKHPAKTVAKAMVVSGIPSLVIRAWIAADDETEEAYQEMPEWRRTGFFNIPCGDGKFISIPKPYAYGIMGVVMEKMVDDALHGNVEFGKDFATVFANQLLPDIQINAVEPLWQVATNKSWNGAAIVSKADEYKLAYEQRDQNSTWLSTTIADLFKDTSLGKDILSPKKMDHLMKQYTGAYGEMFYTIPDKIIDFTRWLADVEEDEVADDVIQFALSETVGNWVQEGYASYPQHRTDFNEIFYDIQDLRNANNRAKIKNHATEQMYQRLKEYDKKLEPLDKQRKEIINNSELTSREKTRQLKTIHQQMGEISRKALAHYQANKYKMDQ